MQNKLGFIVWYYINALPGPSINHILCKCNMKNIKVVYEKTMQNWKVYKRIKPFLQSEPLCLEWSTMTRLTRVLHLVPCFTEVLPFCYKCLCHPIVCYCCPVSFCIIARPWSTYLTQTSNIKIIHVCPFLSSLSHNIQLIYIIPRLGQNPILPQNRKWFFHWKPN